MLCRCGLILAILGVLQGRAGAAPGDQPSGPTGTSMSLAEILQVAVRQSPALQNAAIDIDIARAAVLEASGVDDWLLAAQIGAFFLRDEPDDENIVGTDKVDSYSARISASRLLPTGGTLSLHGTLDRQSRVFAFAGMESLQVSTQVTAQLDQPLLRGRGGSIARARVYQAEADRSAAELEREAAVRSALEDIITAYWETAYAHAALEIRRSSLALATTRRELTQKMINLGSAPRTALTEVDQVIATREEEILVAELDIAERALDLRRLSGLAIGPRDIHLSPSDPLVVAPRDLDVGQVVTQAVASSPELRALDAQKEGAQIAVEVTDNGLLPRLDFSISAGPLGTSDNTRQALENMARANGYSVNALLRGEHNLGRSQAHGADRIARAQLHRISVTRRDLEAQIATAAVRTVTLAKTARKRMEISERAITLSEENIRAEQQRFELGRSTNFDVLQRQEELKQARLRYARASVDYLTAIAFIDSLTGTLLSRYGVKIIDPI